MDVTNCNGPKGCKGRCFVRERTDCQDCLKEANDSISPDPFDTPFDVVGFTMDYECGTLDEDAIIAGFQQLINSGTVWQLQGSYGRTAHALIEHGFCTPAGEVK